VGFTVPIKQWLQGPLAEWASDLLSDRTIAKHGVLQEGVAANAWKRFRSGKGEDPTGLWAMAMLQAWLNVGIEAVGSLPAFRDDVNPSSGYS
jgi:asparagine synthase (glutamine-hydrolysing)